jgi:acyl transferase domain-containing protein
MLRDGVDAVSEVPSDRWDVEAFYDPNPDAPGKTYSRWGGFVRHLDQFDPQFFGITPREAASMDPQQRLLLEVAWEALEHAGQAPAGLAGTRTGVFVGVTGGDYAQLTLRTQGVEGLGAYYASGIAHSIVSGRLSYVLGLEGPSISLDTACSSSLVAVHLAVQSLRTGECNLALAGGVNLILSPEPSITLSKYQMMAPDGRCKFADARADGFVRAEGCAVVVLKRLADAEVDGDRILAVIRGTAVNQDGASSGLTAPNGPAQEAVIRAALAQAGGSKSGAQTSHILILRRSADGNVYYYEVALGNLYDRYGGLVYSVAKRILQDSGAAEEVLQDIFHQLWRAAASFDYGVVQGDARPTKLAGDEEVHGRATSGQAQSERGRALVRSGGGEPQPAAS